MVCLNVNLMTAYFLGYMPAILWPVLQERGVLPVRALFATCSRFHDAEASPWDRPPWESQVARSMTRPCRRVLGSIPLRHETNEAGGEKRKKRAISFLHVKKCDASFGRLWWTGSLVSLFLFRLDCPSSSRTCTDTRARRTRGGREGGAGGQTDRQTDRRTFAQTDRPAKMKEGKKRRRARKNAPSSFSQVQRGHIPPMKKPTWWMTCASVPLRVKTWHKDEIKDAHELS